MFGHIKSRNFVGSKFLGKWITCGRAQGKSNILKIGRIITVANDLGRLYNGTAHAVHCQEKLVEHSMLFNRQRKRRHLFKEGNQSYKRGALSHRFLPHASNVMSMKQPRQAIMITLWNVHFYKLQL